MSNNKHRLEMAKWHPEIRARMRELDLHGFQQLWKRIKPLREKYPDFFGSLHERDLDRVLHGHDNELYHKKDGDYRPISYAIAMALETHPEELFGPVPELNRTRETGDSAIARDKYVANLREAHRNNNMGDPHVIILSREFRRVLFDAIDTCLNDRQKQLVISFYGLNGNKETFEELALQQNCRKQNIDDQIRKSLRKLKHSPELQIYRPDFNPARTLG